MLSWLNANAGAVHGLSTLILLGITTWYAYRTHQATQLAERQFARLLAADPDSTSDDIVAVVPPQPPSTMTQCAEQWKLDVNERYQKTVGIVTSLSTGTIVLPIIFLRNIAGTAPGTSIVSSFNPWLYIGWGLLAVSVLAAIIYCYASAKWVKLAWVQKADMFGHTVSAAAVERILDYSYFAMMAGFMLGFTAIVIFMSSHVG